MSTEMNHIVHVAEKTAKCIFGINDPDCPSTKESKPKKTPTYKKTPTPKKSTDGLDQLSLDKGKGQYFILFLGILLGGALSLKTL